jgi:Zn-finger nucleic acid-binding protein
VSTASDYDCPKCSRKLRVESAEEVDGVDLLVCTGCWGLAVQAKTMQGIVPDEVREKIENMGVKHPEGRSCPVCPSTMLEIEVPKPFGSEDRASQHDVKIDICGDCATIWFDAGELDALNGIKPKLRKVEMEDSADKITAVVDDSGFSVTSRRAAGVFLALLGLMLLGSGSGACWSITSLLVIIGGAILAATVAPETGLEKGACSRCGLEDETIGWTCQRAGCEAPICTTCRSAGQDPAAQYVKTLGGGALMVAGVVLGIGLLVVTEGAVAEGFLPAAAGYELISDDEEEGLLVCKECKKEMGALQFADSDARTERKEWTEKEKKTAAGGPWDVVDSFAGGVKDAESKSAQREEYLKSQTYCLHIDGKTVKRCRRMVYRKSGYCYVHQRE